jgi:tetratricopeptide (TPR) repeat protein
MKIYEDKRWRLAIVLCGAMVIATACTDPQARKREHLDEGWRYFAESNLDKARIEFQNALQIDPDDPAARYGLGQTFERRGDLRTAFGHYTAAADDPTHVESRVALAGILLLAGDPDGAKRRADEATALDAKNAGALAVLAGVLAFQGDAEAAEASARAALASDPKESGAIALLASLYMRANRYEEAHELLREAVAASPRDVGVRAVYAQVLIEANDTARAIEQFEAISAQEPDNLGHAAALVALLASSGRMEEAEGRLDAIVARRADVEAKLMKVEFLERFRNADAALGALRAYVQDDDSAALGLRLAALLEQTGAYDDAEAEYRRIADSATLDKDAADAKVGLAGLLLRVQRAEDAKRTLEEALERAPGNARALQLRARIALAERRFDAAIADARGALRDEPANLAMQLLLAAAYRASGQPLLAKETLMNAVQLHSADAALRRELFLVAGATQDWDLAATQVAALESLGAPASELLDFRFRVTFGRGAHEDALAIARELAALPDGGGMGHFYAATALEALDRAAEAETHYVAALRAKPDAVEPLSGLVKHYLGTSRPAEAEALLESTVQRNVEHAVAWNLLGQVRLTRQDSADAASAFARAIELRPAWALPYRGLASVQRMRGAQDQAERTYRDAIAKTGEAELYVDLAQMLDESGRHDEAIDVYESGVTALPGARTLANNLAMLLVTRRTDEASLERANALIAVLARSDDAAELDTIGWVHYRSGRLAEAEAALTRAVEQLPDAPLLRFHLARVLADAGKRAQAREVLTPALEEPFSELEAARLLHAELAQS